MRSVATSGRSRVVAVESDQASAANAVHRLIDEGFALTDLALVGRDFEGPEEPIGFLCVGDFLAARKFLVLVHGTPEELERASALFVTGRVDEDEPRSA
jgi:hypothetical protein